MTKHPFGEKRKEKKYVHDVYVSFGYTRVYKSGRPPLIILSS